MPIKKKGLGKGLDSLIPDNKSMKSVTSEKTVESKEDAAAKSGVQVMKINEVEPNRDQPRKNFDEDALLELSDSIKQFGVLQPLLVRDHCGRKKMESCKTCRSKRGSCD